MNRRSSEQMRRSSISSRNSCTRLSAVHRIDSAARRSSALHPAWLVLVKALSATTKDRTVVFMVAEKSCFSPPQTKRLKAYSKKSQNIILVFRTQRHRSPGSAHGSTRLLRNPNLVRDQDTRRYNGFFTTSAGNRLPRISISIDVPGAAASTGR